MKGSISAEVVDLNSTRDLGQGQSTWFSSFAYLQRDLFPSLMSALKPDGLLIYRRITPRIRAAADRAIRLSATTNELLRAFQSLRVLHYHEALTGKCVTELVARKVAFSLSTQYSAQNVRIAHRPWKRTNLHTATQFRKTSRPKNHCFACGKDNPDGMHLEFYLDETAAKPSAISRWCSVYTGPPGHSTEALSPPFWTKPWAR